MKTPEKEILEREMNHRNEEEFKMKPMTKDGMMIKMGNVGFVVKEWMEE